MPGALAPPASAQGRAWGARIQGGSAVGTVLTALMPANVSATTVQWTRNGTDIPGATGPTYTTTDADGGSAISYRYVPVVAAGVSVVVGAVIEANILPNAIAAARRNGWQLLCIPDSLGGAYGDSAGTTLPALNAPLGALLDRSFGVETLGPELVANGDFANGTTGYLSASGAAASIVGGNLRVMNGTASYGYSYVNFPTVAGKTYLLTTSRTGGAPTSTVNLHIYALGGAIALNLDAGNPRTFVALDAQTQIQLNAGGNTVGNYTDYGALSVREVLPAENRGPERIASTTDVSSAVWEKEKGAVGAGGLFTPTTESAIHRVAQRVGTGISTAGERVEATVKLKSNGIRYVYLNLNAGWGGQVGIDLTTGATVQNTATRVLPPTLDAEGFWTLTVQAQSVSGTAASAYLWLQANNTLAAGDASWAPNGTNGFYVKSASLRTVLGYHATQATAANKPVVGRVPRKLGPDVLTDKSNIANGGIRTVLVAPLALGKSYVVSGTLSANLQVHDATGVFAVPANRVVAPNPAGGGRLNLYNAGASPISIADVSVREVLEWSYAIQFDASNDTLASTLPSTGTPGVIAFHNAGETVGYASASASGFTLGYPQLAGRAVSVIVASPTAIAEGPDLAAIRRFANHQRGLAL